MNPMATTAILLLAVGTAGLLLNEFVFAWGRPAALAFAAANFAGLVVLVAMVWRKRNAA